MSREERKRAEKKQARADLRKTRLMLAAAQQLEVSQRNLEETRARNDVWRNLLCASAFARGLGNERPISEIVEECVPALLGVNRPMVPVSP